MLKSEWPNPRGPKEGRNPKKANAIDSDIGLLLGLRTGFATALS